MMVLLLKQMHLQNEVAVDFAARDGGRVLRRRRRRAAREGPRRRILRR
jgi:hypothetical protein